MPASLASGAAAACVRAALADALTLALPVDCAGCDAPDVALCEACRGLLLPAVTHRELPGGLTVWSGLAFDGVPARVLRCLKEEGRTALAHPLGGALAAAVRAAAAAVADRATAVDAVVPVPCSRASFRARGYRVVELLARRAGVATAPLLVPARSTADQRGLRREDRRRNVAASMRARRAEGSRVLLLDDVVTTGATLEEAARALRAAGAVVLGAATVASTPRTGIRSPRPATRGIHR